MACKLQPMWLFMFALIWQIYIICLKKKQKKNTYELLRLRHFLPKRTQVNFICSALERQRRLAQSASLEIERKPSTAINWSQIIKVCIWAIMIWKRKQRDTEFLKREHETTTNTMGNSFLFWFPPPPKRMLELSEIVSSSSNLWPRASFPLEAIEIFWPQLYTWSSCNPFHPFLVNILDFFSPPFYLSWKFPIAVCSASQFRALPIQQIPRTNCQLKAGE